MSFPAVASLNRAFATKGMRIRRNSADWIDVLTADYETDGTCWSVEYLGNSSERPCPTNRHATQCLAVRFHPDGAARTRPQGLAADLADTDHPYPTGLDDWTWLPYVPVGEPLTARIVVWAVEESTLMRAGALAGDEPEWDQIGCGRRIARIWRDGRDSHGHEDRFAGLQACEDAPSREYTLVYDPLRPETEDPYVRTVDEDRERYRELLSGRYVSASGRPAGWSVDDAPVDVTARLHAVARWNRIKGREEGREQGFAEGYELGWEGCATAACEEEAAERVDAAKVDAENTEAERRVDPDAD
jgi:hypothetical protein